MRVFLVALPLLVVTKFSSKMVLVRSPILKLSNANPSPPGFIVAKAKRNTTFARDAVGSIALESSCFDSTHLFLSEAPVHPKPEGLLPGFDPISCSLNQLTPVVLLPIVCHIFVGSATFLLSTEYSRTTPSFPRSQLASNEIIGLTNPVRFTAGE